MSLVRSSGKYDGTIFHTLGIGPFHPDARLITGVEDDRETGGVRVYIGARYHNAYSLLVDQEMCERARRAWAGSISSHLYGNFQDLWPIHYEGSCLQ